MDDSNTDADRMYLPESDGYNPNELEITNKTKTVDLERYIELINY